MLWWISWPNGPRRSSPPPPRHMGALEHVFDGSFTLNEAGGGVLLISPKGDRLIYVIRLHLRVTKNVVEYETLINGLCIATELGV
jgi:hypothetical protein